MNSLINKSLFLVLVVFFLVFSGCNSEQNNEQGKGLVPKGGTAGLVESSFDLKIYEKPNFNIKVAYPSDYDIFFEDGDVIFASSEEASYYVLEVILTKNNGGFLDSVEQVRAMYEEQLIPYSGTYLSSSVSKEGFERLSEVTIFSYRYFVDNVEYINEYAVGTDGDYFFVLQFVSPSVVFQENANLRSEIINYFSWPEKISDTKKSVVSEDYEIIIYA